jgi:hypothetical protein
MDEFLPHYWSGEIADGQEILYQPINESEIDDP